MAVRRATLDDVEALRGFILRALEEAGPGALGWTGASEDAVSEIAGVEFLSSLLRRGASPSTSPSRRAPSSDSAPSVRRGVDLSSSQASWCWRAGLAE